MGRWGTGIYDSDDACEVRDEFIDGLREGMSPGAATESVLAEEMQAVLEAAGI